MRIKIKKITSFILSFIIIISTIIDGNVIKNVYAEDNGITRAEWLNKLADTFEMSIDDTNSPDNYFSDINENTEYYEDIMRALSYGIVDIEAGKEFKPNEPASREFAAQTLNACLGYQLEENVEYTFADSSICQYADDDQVAVDKKWFSLIDGKFMPEKQITDAESQKMLDYALTEINKLDVSADYNSTWTVADDVKKIPENVQVIVEDNKVTITNYATNIIKDDIFVVYQGEIAVPFKAVSVSETGNKTVITTTDVDEYENAFNKVDAEGIIETEELTFTSLDGTELEIEMEEESEPVAVLYSARSGLATASSTKKIKDIKFSKTFKISGNTSSSISGTFSNIKVKYNISTSTNETFVQVEGDLNMKGSVGAAINTSINLMQIGIPGIGGVTLTADISAAAKFNSTVTTHILAGVAYSKSGGFRTIRSFKENGGSNTSVEATASLGATLKCGITDLKIISGYVYGKAGITAKIEDKVWAVDTPTNCKTFLAYMYASYGAEVSCKLIDYKYKKSVDIYTLENSPFRVYHHYEDGKPVSKCMRGLTFDYYTKYYSSYWNTGWAGCDSSYGLDDSGMPYAIYEYEVKTDTSKNEYAVITKYKGNMRNLTVPETLDGYEVRGIGHDAFKGNKYIKVLTVPDCITEIGAGAFLGCSNLSEVKLSKGLTKIGGYAFGDCDALTDICIPKSLQETTDAYYYSYFGQFKYGVFIASDNLKNITFEEGTTEIANGLFANNNSIENIVIPDTVTTIEANAFENCTNLKNVKMSSSLTYIGKDAFLYVKGLTEVEIPDTVIEIGAGAFLGCSNLSEVKLSKGLTKIGGYAFGDCDALTDICIPKSLQETTDAYYYSYFGQFKYGVFIASDNLKNITFEEGTTEIANGLFANNNSIENIVIPDTVTTIEANAFENCTNLKNVKMSSSLTYIGKDAFLYVKGLTKVEIPDTVIEIGAGAFLGCSNLSEVKLSKGLTKLGGYAFGDCDALTDICIPKSLKETTDAYYHSYFGQYKNGVFIASDNLKNITFEEGITEIANGLFAHNSSIENIVIPDTVTKIEESVFKNCSALKQIKLSNKLESIGWEAFYGAVKLEKVEIPDTVTNIGDGCFNNCTSLSYVKLPNTRENINTYMFYGCASLKNITLPDAVKYIRKNAFEGSGLTSIKMSPNVTIIEDRAFADTPLKNVEFSGKETSIGNEAFKNCDELQSLSLPNSVTYLGSGAFQDCDTLKEIKLPTRITSVLLNTFEHCDALQSIVIPYKVKEIKDNAFANSPKLKEVTIPKSTTTISSNAFSYPAITTVYGITGTYAETYANEKGMKFVNKEVSASKVTLSQSEITMNVNSTKELILDVAPIDFTDEIDLKSSDNKVVTIDENGKVKAVGVGTATIKVTAGNASATCKVNVVQPINSIGLNMYKLDLECDETYRLIASISPWNANNKDVEWSSSDVKVVTVDQNGDIKAIGKGKAVITVTAKDGNGASAKCEVTVLNNNYVITDVSKMESNHPYENNCKDVWTYTVKDAQALEITFDEKTEIEDGFDNLIILDANNKQIGTYTGKELSGKTITVSGNTVKIKLDTDKGGSAYGFKISNIKVVEQHNTIYGDTNNDAEINIKDSALIKRYLAGIDVEINENAADVDGDGKITIKDSALVKRYLAGWEVEFEGSGNIEPVEPIEPEEQGFIKDIIKKDEIIYSFASSMSKVPWAPNDTRNILKETDIKGVYKGTLTAPAYNSADMSSSRFAIIANFKDEGYVVQSIWNRILLGMPSVDPYTTNKTDNNLTNIRIMVDKETKVTVYFDSSTYAIVIKDELGNDVDYAISWIGFDDNGAYYYPDEISGELISSYYRDSVLGQLGIDGNDKIPDFVKLQNDLKEKIGK